MNRLILTVGLPRSGKTTWALKQECPVVSPDAIRLALHGRRFWEPGEKLVWAHAWTMVAALFHAGHRTVIVDATHITKKRRDFWESPGMGDHPDSLIWEVHLQVIVADVEMCITRAKAQNDNEIIPIIERMAAQAEWPGV